MRRGDPSEGRLYQAEEFPVKTSLTLIPALVDVLFVVLYSRIVGYLVERFQHKALANALLIGGVYLLLCVVVFLFKKVASPAASGPLPSAGALIGVQAACFAFFALFMAADTAGFFTYLQAAPDASSNTALMVTVLGAMALALAYVAVLAVDVRATVALRPAAYALVEAGSLVVINAMILCIVAFWQVYFADVTPYENLAVGGKVLVFLGVYIFYLLFVSSPRVVLLARDFALLTVLSFLLSSAYYVWTSLARTAW